MTKQSARMVLAALGLAACAAPQPTVVNAGVKGCPAGMMEQECNAFRRHQFLVDKGCTAGETPEQCEARQRQRFQSSLPAEDTERPKRSAQRFPEILHELSATGMSPAEQVVVKRCKQQAEAVYNIAVAVHPIGSYQPDMVATARLRDCLIADAPSR